MDVITKVIGNLHDAEWAKRLKDCHVETILLDPWTAQKSRFYVRGENGTEYRVALQRGERISDGDIVVYNPDKGEAALLRLNLNEVLVIDLSKLLSHRAEEIIRVCVELGHAIGNQHWPAVVKGSKVYIPLTIDKKVMLAVMETHNIDNIAYEFRRGMEIIPYLAPSELRRLFGGAGHECVDHHHTKDECQCHC